MTQLRRGTLYSVPWAAEIRSWERASRQTGVTVEQLRADIAAGFSQPHSGHDALADQVDVGHITIVPGLVTSDSVYGEVRLRPASDMAAEDGFARQMDASLNFRLRSRVADRDTFGPYVPWFGTGGYAREPIVANPDSNYRAPDSRDAVERAASYATTRTSTDPAVNNTSSAGNDIRSLVPGWVVPVAVVGGILAALVAGAYVYRTVAG